MPLWNARLVIYRATRTLLALTCCEAFLFKFNRLLKGERAGAGIAKEFGHIASPWCWSVSASSNTRAAAHLRRSMTRPRKEIVRAAAQSCPKTKDPAFSGGVFAFEFRAKF
jgi:hypothetical protein